VQSVARVNRIPSAGYGGGISSGGVPSTAFADTSTWEQIIGILEEISVQSVAGEKPDRRPAVGMSEVEELRKHDAASHQDK
jgi:hypothetical protein